MLLTSEIRWFIKGEIPGQVRDWFLEHTGKPTAMPARTDYYLCLPDAGIGIKIREGLLEHKQRSRGEDEKVRDGEVERWRDGEGERWRDGENSGIVERWEKLSFPIHNSNAVQETLSTYTESWIGIEKERFLRILELDEKGSIVATTYEMVKGTACGWELTGLRIVGRDELWWTLGFEAFGNAGQLHDTLFSICDHIMKDSPFKFKAVDSLSYPEWFTRL